jgi:drug/metabolite transporter (DMT)-like permease
MWCTSGSGLKPSACAVENSREAAQRIAGFRSQSQPMTPFIGIMLALACALATNVGFLYKHRGACAAPAVDMRRPLRSARSLFGSRLFAIGMVIAAGAWLFHVAAMSMVPLSLVQAVLAGGVVLLAIMAERMFGLKIGRRQWLGLGLTAVGLMLLGVTLPAVHGAHSRFSVPGMIAFEAGLLAAGTLLIMGPRIGAPKQHHGFMLGAAAGILFGVSDVAIKAISGLIGTSGVLGLLTPWTLVAVAASVAAFYASAKGLQDGEAIPVIAVTSTAANVAGIVGGIIVFGDPLSANPVSLIVQCFAFVLVLTAAWLMPAPMRAAGAPA